MKTTPTEIKIKFYSRYVDEFTVLNGNKRQASSVEKYLNSLHYNINFIMDPERISEENYLVTKIKVTP